MSPHYRPLRTSFPHDGRSCSLITRCRSTNQIRERGGDDWLLVPARRVCSLSGGLPQTFQSRPLSDLELKERNIRTKKRLLTSGATRGGIPFERGTPFYLLRNRFYIGEVRYKDDLLPGGQPPIMERALFDAVQQKLTNQWTAKTSVRNPNDHFLTGLLFDDAGYPMAPTHATKAGIRYRNMCRCRACMERPRRPTLDQCPAFLQLISRTPSSDPSPSI
jgi:hypothetical protein